MDTTSTDGKPSVLSVTHAHVQLRSAVKPSKLGDYGAARCPGDLSEAMSTSVHYKEANGRGWCERAGPPLIHGCDR